MKLMVRTGTRHVHRMGKGAVEFMQEFSLRDDFIARVPWCRTNEWTARRVFNRHRMWSFYQEACEGLGIESLGRTTFHEWLSSSVFKDQKPYECACSQCIDFGDAAFLFLEEVIQKLPADASKKALLRALRNQQVWYKAHFRRLVITNAEIPALPDGTEGPPRPCQLRVCVSHALGKPGSEFGPPCTEQHVDSDPVLLEVWAVVDAIEKASMALLPAERPAEDREITLQRQDLALEFKNARSNMTSYMAHLLRKAVCDMSSKSVLRGLELGQAVGSGDYSEKPEPSGYKQSQTERFGKSGMSMSG